MVTAKFVLRNWLGETGIKSNKTYTVLMHKIQKSKQGKFGKSKRIWQTHQEINPLIIVMKFDFFETGEALVL